MTENNFNEDLYTVIDPNNYWRKGVLRFLDDKNPYANVSVKFDITEFKKYVEQKELPFTLTFDYVCTDVLNSIEEFRVRLVEEEIRLYHDICAMVSVIDDKTGELKDILIPNTDTLEEFIDEGTQALNGEQKRFKGKRINFYNFISLPWIPFESATQMWRPSFYGSPLLNTSKIQKDGDRELITVTISVDHRLVDGRQIGQWYENFQDILNNPEKIS